MNVYDVKLPMGEEMLKKIKIGDMLKLSGEIYTARDAAHKRLFEAIENNNPDMDLMGKVIYYVGPTPHREDLVIGSAGPTTSQRMDKYTPKLMENGLRITIGKGDRDSSVQEACKDYGGLYLCATGGVGALMSECIIECEEILYLDLGTESIKRLVVKDFPVYVAIDSYGNNFFE